jgi:hypothetical protein
MGDDGDHRETACIFVALELISSVSNVRKYNDEQPVRLHRFSLYIFLCALSPPPHSIQYIYPLEDARAFSRLILLGPHPLTFRQLAQAGRLYLLHRAKK